MPGSPAALAANDKKALDLELAIVKRLADLMGEPVTLKFAPGRDTVFTITSPLGKAVPMAAATQWAQARDPLATRPHLLMVDYRLESGHSGVEATHALHAEFGNAVPAIMVITSSTMTDHDA